MKTSRGASDGGDIRSKKKKARRILRPDEKQKSKETIPVSLPASERFYAGLLRSEANDFLGESKGLWKTICYRLALPVPTVPLLSSYSNIQDHFSNRAALVIEEARQALADGIRLLKQDFKSDENGRNSNYRGSAAFPPKYARTRHSNKDQSSISMETSITRVEHKGSGHSILTFSKKFAPFTKDEMLILRQGTIFSCLDRKTTHSIENIFLGVVLPQNREEMIKSNSFVVLLFRKIKKTNKGNWKLTPILSLLSEQRKFEACMNQMTTPVPFLLPLLGRKRSHIRTVHDTIDDQHAVDVEAENLDEFSADSSSDCEVLEIVDLESTFHIPRLNAMQEKAATAFLKSKSDTISLIQGPPGTGKTTLLTSVICRYIIDSRKLVHKKRCLMVCAPTNKAVTVLCRRFLNTFFDDVSCPCNVVLLGDEDKILENEPRTRGNVTSENSKLRENFLYTFIDAIKDEYLYVRKVLDKAKVGSYCRIQKIVCRLNNLLMQKVTDKDVIASADSIVKLIKKFAKSRDKRYPTEIINKVDLIVGMIGAWNQDVIWQKVLRSADVVFCTLGSSGSSVLKKMIGKIDDLVVDEAAAATEPEIYIPFQYLPRRLLCVGDPKQLPATIISQFAEKMGLSKSLHERLMYDCNYDHIMLDTQYRMKPALSKFPSKNFYEGKLINGRNVLSSRNRCEASMIGRSAYTLYQIDGKERQNQSGSMENEAEANAVIEIVDNLRQTSRSLSSNWCSTNRLRIITFYQAQVSLIKRLLQKRNLGSVLVATVDSSQGCEADFVIISFVRSSREGGRNSVGFVADDRRLNVALTRAKYELICVGNIERMASLPDCKAGSVKRLAIDAFDRKCVHPFPSQNRSSFKTIHDDNFESVMERKRKPEPIETNCRQGGSRNKTAQASSRANQDIASNASSSTGPDSDSSVISSSSSDSDSSTSDSSQAQSCKPNVQIDSLISTVRPNLINCQATPSDSLVPKCEAGHTITEVIDKNVPANEQKKVYVDSDLPVSLEKSKNASSDEEKTSVSRTTHETDTATSKNLEVAGKIPHSEEGQESAPDDPVESNQTQPSLLSKAETMAVFEDFLF